MRQIKSKVWTGTQMLDSGFSINPHGQIYDIHKNHQPDWITRQFIGLQDKSGVDYYVGDIGMFPDGDMFIVKMEEWLEVYIDWISEPECEDQARDLPRISNATIIGNIHQNPELIK